MALTVKGGANQPPPQANEQAGKTVAEAYARLEQKKSKKKGQAAEVVAEALDEAVQGEGVERTFPIHSPKVVTVEVKRRGRVRRAKLYYLRDRVGKATRVKEKQR